MSSSALTAAQSMIPVWDSIETFKTLRSFAIIIPLSDLGLFSDSTDYTVSHLASLTSHVIRQLPSNTNPR